MLSASILLGCAIAVEKLHLLLNPFVFFDHIVQLHLTFFMLGVCCVQLSLQPGNSLCLLLQ